MKKFPIFKAGTILNKIDLPYLNNKKFSIHLHSFSLNFPCRLDAMAIDPANVAYNSNLFFTPGEVVISIKRYIKLKVRVLSDKGKVLKISQETKRKVLVKHAYLLMCRLLNVAPSLEISVDDSDILKHCGFGSSSSTLMAVAAAINEMYGKPVKKQDLIKYITSNHGEEVSDTNETQLKLVQCIGGGANSGLNKEGIIIIAGRACPIAKMLYPAKVIIGIPNDFVPKDAKYLMELEEKNLHKFQYTGKKYGKQIAYHILHRALPEMTQGKITELADIVFEYRFNMGSNKNCSFVFPRINTISKKIKYLFEDKICDFLALSSVGPAFFAIANDPEKIQKICNEFSKNNMNCIITDVCNNKYIIHKDAR